MAVSNHFSAGMAYRVSPVSGVLEFLTISYKQENKPVQRKFPGGTNRISVEPLRYHDEDPIDTLMREWRNEVGQSVWSFTEKFRFPMAGDHVQYFFLLHGQDHQGEYRSEPKVEREKGRPDELLGVPEWVPAIELLRKGGPYEIFGSHRKALDKAMEYIKAAESAAA